MDGSTLTTDLYDKRTLPAYANIPVLRFPHWNDALDYRTKLNVMASQIIRYYRICGDNFHFVIAVNELARDMVRNGYPKAKVQQIVRRSFRRLVLIYNRTWMVAYMNFAKLFMASTFRNHTAAIQ